MVPNAVLVKIPNTEILFRQKEEALAPLAPPFVGGPVFNKFVLPSFATIVGRSHVFNPFLSRFVVFRKTVAEF